MTTGREEGLGTGTVTTGADMTPCALPREALKAHREEIVSTLARHHMRNPQVFGSVATATDIPDSDLDLLVDADADLDLLDLVDAAEELETLLGLHVDIVTSRCRGQRPGDVPNGSPGVNEDIGRTIVDEIPADARSTEL